MKLICHEIQRCDKWTFEADTSNWSKVQTPNTDDDSILGTDGFYAFGVDGVFRGVVILLFLFNTFDMLLMSRSHHFTQFSKRHSNKSGTSIQHFGRTLSRGILSINTTIFLTLLGMAIALTITQPVYRLVSCAIRLTLIDFITSEYLMM